MEGTVNCVGVEADHKPVVFREKLCVFLMHMYQSMAVVNCKTACRRIESLKLSLLS